MNGCYYNLEGPIEEYLKCYDELKRNKHIFKTIEPDFFFKFTEYLINKNKQLEEKNQDYKCNYYNIAEIMKTDYISKSKVENIIGEKIEELYEEMEECNLYDDEDNEEKRELTDMIVLLKEISKELLEK